MTDYEDFENQMIQYVSEVSQIPVEVLMAPIPTPEQTRKRNKEIQDQAKKIIDSWPDWKKAYIIERTAPHGRPGKENK